jgi:hypothetical protein
MHLPKPFFRLPRRFDAARLADEAQSIPQSVWVPHPNGIAGNSSVRLISVDGGDNDSVEGLMQETPHLALMPYARQILASFGVPWSRTRLLRLAPGANVPPHADINYHWFYRVRMHIPIITRPEVRFHCDGTSVHMAPGEAWIFDNWRLHTVVNPTPYERIHLVADTAGNSAFWSMVNSPEAHEAMMPYTLGPVSSLRTERNLLRPIMNPTELELLVGNLRGELIPSASQGAAGSRLETYHAVLDGFVRDWRQLYFLHGEESTGWADFAALRDSVRRQSQALAEAITVRTNGVAAHRVLEARVLRVCIPASLQTLPEASTAKPFPYPATQDPLARPLVIVAAPRSGSTLLFETLAASGQFVTLGGEAHWLVESIPALVPGAPGVESNRLTRAHANEAVDARIRQQILERLLDNRGQPPSNGLAVRFLEKTPKNALRIPFFKALFPQAQFVFLWREPQGNISSIIEAWRSGRWRTYPQLVGFDPPWSLLLPPGWEGLRGKSLEQIAAFQWRITNEIVLDDLANLPKRDWMALSYQQLVSEPSHSIERILDFSSLSMDATLLERLSAPLPQAKHTLNAASPEKWKLNAAAVEAVMPHVQATWERLQGLQEENS